MRIGFVEVRDKTYLLVAASSRLLGHDVSWLVQNHQYAHPAMANTTVLRYPTKRDLQTAGSPESRTEREHIRQVMLSDRFYSAFGMQLSHYWWYYKRVRAWFERDRPDLIVGEVGNFHSHMASLIAEDQGVPFLNPISSRYPRGRFAFFRGDRLRPFGGDSSGVSESMIADAVEEIRTGRRKPDYMSSNVSRAGAMHHRVRTLRGWATGERFATQSPAFFARETVKRTIARKRWDHRSVDPSRLSSATRHASPRILYPLQMQPELNLDIWGREFADQQETIRRIASGPGVVIVKPNPKSFHEMRRETLDVLSLDGVIGLQHSAQMAQVEAACDLVVTASGTIAIERLLRRRPVAILLTDYARWLGVPSATDLGLSLDCLDSRAIDAVEESQRNVDPAEVLWRIVSTSYPGIISEPHRSNVLDEHNIEKVVRALQHVTRLVDAQGRSS